MGLHYLTFMGKIKNLMSSQAMNSVGLNNKIIVNYVSIFNDVVSINSGYRGIVLDEHCNSIARY